jgi:enoyl-CoA hydratase
MMTDFIVCTPKAVFAQPEITLGIIPGGGGSQRLVTLIGKGRAMDMVLTNRKVSGVEAGQWGLASRVTEDGQSVVEEAVKVADGIAKFGVVAAQAGKEAVNAALELPLAQGLRLERRLFQALFATADQKEGMAAFAEKRKPTWTDN